MCISATGLEAGAEPVMTRLTDVIRNRKRTYTDHQPFPWDVPSTKTVGG